MDRFSYKYKKKIRYTYIHKFYLNYKVITMYLNPKIIINFVVKNKFVAYTVIFLVLNFPKKK